ncbi:hypothetical protein [Streptomyces sp. WMMC905]|uniref:hypothetical protein n=1 Tax=Streptomyces sp. WMMC905 TaxID=3404123 RepID=UPI003B9267E0
MRRTARSLSTAVVAAYLTGGVAAAVPEAGPTPAPSPAAPERRDAGVPTAWSVPATVAPGGAVDLSVSCPAPDGTPPDTVAASSPVLEGGGATLRRDRTVGEANDGAVAYAGSALLAFADPAAGPGEPLGTEGTWTVDGVCPEAADAPVGVRAWSVPLTVRGEAADDACGEATDLGEPCPTDPTCAEPEPDRNQAPDPDPLSAPEPDQDQPDTPGAEAEAEGEPEPEVEQREDRPPEQRPGGAACHPDEAAEGQDPSGEDPVEERPADRPPSEERVPETAAPRLPGAVHAGSGGSLSDSLPALVAGGALVAGACGLTVHRLARGRFGGRR